MTKQSGELEVASQWITTSTYVQFF